MKKYFWLCSYSLKPGSIIEPGNWGRIINLYYSPGDNDERLAREYIFEKVRLENYPDRPSRLTSTFLCEDLQGAINFKNATGRKLDIIYEVEILDKNKPLFRTDWSLVASQDLVKQIETKAHKYWQVTDIKNPEALTLSDIRIVKRVDN